MPENNTWNRQTHCLNISIYLLNNLSERNNKDPPQTRSIRWKLHANKKTSEI